MSAGLNWFCVQPEDAWGAATEEVRALIRKDFVGEWGDRRQELVFIGEKLNVEGIKQLFDACLLTEREMRRWEKIMRRRYVDEERREDMLLKVWEDGWEDWANPMLEEEEENDDEHAGHSHGTGAHRHHLSL